MANDVYNGFLDQALSEQMSKAGGIGLGRMLSESFGVSRTIGSELAISNDSTVRAVKMAAEGIGPLKEKPVAPLKNSYLGSRFGKRFSTRTQSWHFHKGIDLNVPEGTPIVATLGGKIKVARNVNGYGNAIYIDHGNGLQSRYGHASKLLVKEGEEVKAGQQIALSGNTGLSDGPHLHFEVRLDNVAINPEPWLGSQEMRQAAANYGNVKPLYAEEQFDNETKGD
ncbi:MAG: peptidoglycan DD-metalloendopeptidase family protein [Deltaproteobacteria bacterium]|nr:peptidoglycan DD-metalloendopeptidase family protein [Deltaproteobacteria bacterium]